MRSIGAFWRSISTRRKRVYSILFILVLAIISIVIGSMTTFSHDDAVSRSNTINQTLNRALASDNLTQTIFINNFSLTLLMFIPLVGVGIGLFIMYNTGVGLAAISTVQGYPASTAILDLMANPIFWLEFVSYSIAMASSIWLIRRLLQERWGELKSTAASIAVCALLLGLGALIEAWQIQGHI
jgi:uncharacterized membrane protein SpoIIM required for sporulation